MKLKSLELQGFKSFPDRTVLNFNAGATIVVGPNGSGKSNISDAIRWVLGETSAKGVRGSKMEDVIFSGAGSRKQMGTAEVSLILDNTDELTRIPDRGDEIVVTRRCFRGGESEYMIDRRPARLRDITELFMNTGVGRSGYSIIGQGKIAEIISQKSEDRRAIFEEAAGISKYRFRKNEEERNMERVKENMTRAEDILRELEQRVAPLERDAEKARKYLELYEEKKRTDVALWLFDVEDVRKKVRELSDSCAVAKRMLDEADGELSALEAKNERMYSENQATKLRSEQLQRQLRENSEAILGIDGNIKVIDNELEHLRERKKEAQNALALHTAAASDTRRNAEALRGGLDGLRAELRAEREKHAAMTGDTDALKAERELLERQMSEKDGAVRELRDSLVKHRLRLSEFAGQRDSKRSRAEEIGTELVQVRERDAVLRERIAKAERTIGEYTERADKSKEERETLTASLSSRTEELEQQRRKQSELSSEMSVKRQHADTLRRMEEHFEGYSGSVRFVMENAERGRLSGVLGPVSRMITVPRKYSVAVETALGANIQNIIVEDEDAAKSAIALLKSSGAGRATFYPISSVKAQPLNLDKKQLERSRGYIGVASELIGQDSRCREIIAYMLGRTLVFDDLSNASDYAKATGFRVRIVTLDGQIINAGGSFTGGSAKRDSGMLTRAHEISRFEEEAQKIEIDLTACTERIDALTKDMDGIKEALEDKDAELSVIGTMLDAEKTQQLLLKNQLEGDGEQAKRLEDMLAVLRSEDEKEASERDELETGVRRAEEALRAAEEDAAQLERKHGEVNRAIASSIDSAGVQLAKVTGIEKDIEALEKSISDADIAADSVEEQIDRDKEAIVSAEQAEKDNRERLTEAQGELDKLRAEAQRLDREREALSELGSKNDAALAGLREQIKEETHRREQLFRSHTKIESDLSRAESEQDKLSSELWEEYELTYATAAALDYPPVTEETRPEFSSRQSTLRSKIKALGPVNIGAIEEYKEVSERAVFMRTQYDDLCTSRDDLAKIITDLESEMRTRFVAVMAQLDASFKQTFRALFGGGTAELRLTDPEDPLGCGIEINAAPPGKIVKSMSLLSGGEQSFVAVALFFAILNVNPTPFAVLDEIEAALDDVNVARFADYIKRYSDQTQFVVITHRRGTMEIADTLYGVTMPERGISRVISLSISEAENRLGVKLN